MTNPPITIYTGGAMEHIANLAEQITKVLDMHQPYSTTTADQAMRRIELCGSCFEEYPCRTVYVLRGDS